MRKSDISAAGDGERAGARTAGGLVGLYFVVVRPAGKGGYELVRQGRVADDLGGGFYLIDVQEWAMGRSVRQELARIDRMEESTWWFYAEFTAQQAEVARRLSVIQRGA